MKFSDREAKDIPDDECQAPDIVDMTLESRPPTSLAIDCKTCPLERARMAIAETDGRECTGCEAKACFDPIVGVVDRISTDCWRPCNAGWWVVPGLRTNLEFCRFLGGWLWVKDTLTGISHSGKFEAIPVSGCRTCKTAPSRARALRDVADKTFLSLFSFLETTGTDPTVRQRKLESRLVLTDRSTLAC